MQELVVECTVESELETSLPSFYRSTTRTKYVKGLQNHLKICTAKYIAEIWKYLNLLLIKMLREQT